MSAHPRFNLNQAATDAVRGNTCITCHTKQEVKYFKRWDVSEPIKTVPIGDALSLFCIGLALILLIQGGRRAWSTF